MENYFRILRHLPAFRVFGSQLVIAHHPPAHQGRGLKGANGKGLNEPKLPCLQASVAKVVQSRPFRTLFCFLSRVSCRQCSRIRENSEALR